MLNYCNNITLHIKYFPGQILQSETETCLNRYAVKLAKEKTVHTFPFTTASFLALCALMRVEAGAI